MEKKGFYLTLMLNYVILMQKFKHNQRWHVAIGAQWIHKDVSISLITQMLLMIDDSGVVVVVVVGMMM